jgi:hypothetical protein
VPERTGWPIAAGIFSLFPRDHSIHVCHGRHDAGATIWNTGQEEWSAGSVHGSGEFLWRGPGRQHFLHELHGLGVERGRCIVFSTQSTQVSKYIQATVDSNTAVSNSIGVTEWIIRVID